MTILWAEILVVASAHLWVAWVATVALHTMVLASMAWLIARRGRIDPSDEAVLWRLVLIAPPATATVPALFGVRTWGTMPLPSLVPANVTVWQGSVVILLLLALVLATRLRRALHERRALRACFGVRYPCDALLVAEVKILAAAFGLRSVRATMSDRSTAPAAIGSHEICLNAAFAALPDGQRAAIIAHELAHLARRDTAWFRWSRRAAWSMPGAAWLMRALRRASELAADDRAVKVTGDADALAAALVAVASAIPPAPVVAASTGSPLVERVLRLMEPHGRGRQFSRCGRVLMALSLVTATLVVAPGFRLTPDDAGNRVEWLRPGKGEPNHRLLYVRYTVRRIERRLRSHF